MEENMTRHSLAILTSHPIQYQAPFFAALAANGAIDLTVYFMRNAGVDRPMYDPEFGREVQWDIPLLYGYRYEFLGGLISFLRALRRSRPEALLVYGWNSPYAWAGAVTAKMLGISFWIRGENPLSQEDVAPTAARRMKRRILRALFRLTDAFLYIGEENRKFYLHLGVPGAKLFFVPYAVDNDRFFIAAEKLRAKRNALRSERGIPEDAVVVLFVGKLIEKKRPQDVLSAFASAAKRSSRIRFTMLFAGDGALSDFLMAEVTAKQIPRVHFLGFQNQGELPEIYAMSDIFMLPSGKGETWGLVVNEAMCFGLPVVISDIVGSGPDLVRSGENGFIVPFGDAGGLAEALLRLGEDAKLRARFGARSREIVSRYSFAEDIRGIMSAYAASQRKN